MPFEEPKALRGVIPAKLNTNNAEDESKLGLKHFVAV